jgi:glycosyltransferase involved in cell wall biosynthesis
MPAAIIVPCLNERSRFPAYATALARACPGALVVSVDDGSSEPLRAEDAPAAIRLAYPGNRGKGHAVRHGWDWVAANHPEVELLAFADADGAVPAREIARLLRIMLQSPETSLLAAARVALLGRRVERHPLRHYMGRLFATFSSILLDLPAYDTQCGCKWVRRSAYLSVRNQLSIDGFAFDVELIAQILRCGGHVQEEPVDWVEQGGSKVGLLRDGMRMAGDLIRLRKSLHGP